jgi:hypothetical protein
MIMQKILCRQCRHHDTCPSRTKMLVNYCGSQSAKLQSMILEAQKECMHRCGNAVLFAQTIRYENGRIQQGFQETVRRAPTVLVNERENVLHHV